MKRCGATYLPTVTRWLRLHPLLFCSLLFTTLAACKHEKDPDNPASPSDTAVTTPWAFAANPRLFPDPAPEPRDNHTSKEGVALGEALFFDPVLSIDSTISCASCHRPAQGFSDPRRQSQGVFGLNPRRHSMALANQRWEHKFFWDGRENSLEEQIENPISAENEMALPPEQVTQRMARSKTYPALFLKAFGPGKADHGHAVKALAQFVRTLVSTTSKYDLYLSGQDSLLTPQELRGMKLFFTHPDPAARLRGGNCGDCHMPYTTAGSIKELDGFRNNGLQTDQATGDAGLMEVTHNSRDWGKFKVPSLRNIALTAPYMHDGSLSTLEDVLDHYNHTGLKDRPGVDVLIAEATNQRFGQSLLLTDQEKQDIIAFLHTLTDTAFVNYHARRHPQ